MTDDIYIESCGPCSEDHVGHTHGGNMLNEAERNYVLRAVSMQLPT